MQASQPDWGKLMVALPGGHFTYGTVPAGEFLLDYAHAGPDDAATTIVSLPGSAGMEMSTAKDRLAERYRIIEINPPGWRGKNDLNRAMSQSELGRLLADAANALVDGPYYLLGTSVGGGNALHAAAANPPRVRGLILEGSMAPARAEDLYTPPIAIDETSDSIPHYPVPPPHPRKPWATEEFVHTQMAYRFATFRRLEPDLLPEEAFRKVIDARIPVLALLGDHDNIVKPSQTDAYATYLPHADFRLIPHGEHDLQNTTPEEFVSLVDNFVAQ